ncbi:uncharacterized protein LOC126671401 [Mercurialis annua]|uniref:uncharacterized protein LOC126671401 n=1 Tax=Mercurialis annua TaxID=3986 RepID=UPI00215FF6A3|nr:uncharacterized protein LOC126671401 [Mercurialis annua]
MAQMNQGSGFRAPPVMNPSGFPSGETHHRRDPPSRGISKEEGRDDPLPPRDEFRERGIPREEDRNDPPPPRPEFRDGQPLREEGRNDPPRTRPRAKIEYQAPRGKDRRDGNFPRDEGRHDHPFSREEGRNDPPPP